VSVSPSETALASASRAAALRIASFGRPVDPDDLPPIKRGLPPELANVADVEFVRADICREELLVEIEIVVDVDRV